MKQAEPSRLFFEMLLGKVNDQADVIERIFPNRSTYSGLS